MSIVEHRCVVVDFGLQVELALSPPLRVLKPPKVIFLKMSLFLSHVQSTNYVGWKEWLSGGSPPQSPGAALQSIRTHPCLTCSGNLQASQPPKFYLSSSIYSSLLADISTIQASLNCFIAEDATMGGNHTFQWRYNISLPSLCFQFFETLWGWFFWEN